VQDFCGTWLSSSAHASLRYWGYAAIAGFVKSPGACGPPSVSAIIVGVG
jgi:hypothetical protein